jgi:hypothetical protein
VVDDWDDTRGPGWDGYAELFAEAAARAVADTSDDDA